MTAPAARDSAFPTTVVARLLHIQVRGLDDVPHALRLAALERIELGARAADNVDAEYLELFGVLRFSHDLDHFFADLLEDRGGHRLRRNDAIPAEIIEAGHAFGDRR